MSFVNRQLNRLYAFTVLSNLSIAGAAWVLLLVTQGYTLIEVGIAETVFHLVSLTAEIPSGVFADVIGRKKSLMLSCVMGILSALIRAYWNSFPGVCVSVAFSALTYNFVSGSDNALAYDTLLENGCEERYGGYISKQTVLYRVTNGLATLGAGLAVMMGNVAAQWLGAGLSILRLALAATLEENAVVKGNPDSPLQKIRACYAESRRFLHGNSAAARLIFRNALVGGVDVLLLFFLQAKLPMAGMADWALGPALFFMSMGGVLGAAVSRRAEKRTFRQLFLWCLALVSLGFLAAFTQNAFVMALGGFLAAFADDLIQIRADVELNAMVPPAQRATLISVASFCFSLVMIVLSPLAGWVFSL